MKPRSWFGGYSAFVIETKTFDHPVFSINGILMDILNVPWDAYQWQPLWSSLNPNNVRILGGGPPAWVLRGSSILTMARNSLK